MTCFNRSTKNLGQPASFKNHMNQNVSAYFTHRLKGFQGRSRSYEGVWWIRRPFSALLHTLYTKSRDVDRQGSDWQEQNEVEVCEEELEDWGLAMHEEALERAECANETTKERSADGSVWNTPSSSTRRKWNYYDFDEMLNKPARAIRNWSKTKKRVKLYVDSAEMKYTPEVCKAEKREGFSRKKTMTVCRSLKHVLSSWLSSTRMIISPRV